MNVKVKQRIPLKIKKMGINGEGIGFYKKTLVFVPGALKGEEVYCQVTRVQRNFIEAKLLTINKRSKFRVEAPCEIYDSCGGCQIMHLHYDKQLEFKEDLLRQALKKFAPAGYENYEIRPTIVCRSRSIIGPSCSFRLGSSRMRSRLGSMPRIPTIWSR